MGVVKGGEGDAYPEGVLGKTPEGIQQQHGEAVGGATSTLWCYIPHAAGAFVFAGVAHCWYFQFCCCTLCGPTHPPSPSWIGQCGTPCFSTGCRGYTDQKKRLKTTALYCNIDSHFKLSQSRANTFYSHLYCKKAESLSPVYRCHMQPPHNPFQKLGRCHLAWFLKGII